MLFYKIRGIGNFGFQIPLKKMPRSAAPFIVVSVIKNSTLFDAQQCSRPWYL